MISEPAHPGLFRERNIDSAGSANIELLNGKTTLLDFYKQNTAGFRLNPQVLRGVVWSGLRQIPT
ncbi:hypothetical protein ColTof4_07597 [Colletotrichum tofieldiae]|nr:hypothetical protein ColTof3_12550 [Colletotrichum tofieldiae]GKT75174.1 hypothetical protein ColTof4_07597 [Colletotrichum tofieldiae]GKT92413.1 hypothetical protein Ct61P_10263 [Colletotrichum tofieldiae]